jgi:hypothetical protein
LLILPAVLPLIWRDGHHFSTAAQGQLPDPPED